MYCISVSHKKAPVSVREKFAFSMEEKKELLKRLTASPEIDGAVVLCTCNRSEFYVSGSKKAISILQNAVADLKQIRLEELLQYLNIYSEEQTVAHVYKVCCGFDSMVLGEDEILGQVKDAYQMTLEEKAANYEINVIFQKAITCAKKTKTDTNLSRTPVSVATLVANEVFHFEKEGQEAQEKKVLIMGVTGKIGSTIAKNILSKSGIEVYGTVRSHKSDLTFQWKSSHIHLVDYADRYQYMEDADIVISATSSPHYTVVGEKLEKVLKTNKKRLFIDVAVPIDIDPMVGEIEGVTLYDIDFFDKLSKTNNQMKLKELDAAREIMNAELDECKRELLFHPCFQKMGQWKEIFQAYSLDTILYRIRDHVSSEELKVVLNVMDHIGEWVEE